jgi:inner membrane protein
MPSPIAHAVTGYCLGKLWPKLLLPELKGSMQKRLLLGISIFSAIAADLDFVPQLVSDFSFHRGISHSLGAGLLLSVVLAFIFRGRIRNFLGRVVLLAFGAYALHLVMDILTTGGRGIPLYWPASSQLVQLPITIFPQVHHSEGLFYSGHIPVLLFEITFAAIAVYLTHIAICLLDKRVFRRT